MLNPFRKLSKLQRTVLDMPESYLQKMVADYYKHQMCVAVVSDMSKGKAQTLREILDLAHMPAVEALSTANFFDVKRQYHSLYDMVQISEGIPE